LLDKQHKSTQTSHNQNNQTNNIQQPNPSTNQTNQNSVHTLCLPITSELGDLYRASDGGATACLLGKLAAEKALMSRLDETRAALQVCWLRFAAFWFRFVFFAPAKPPL
jgi:hypothetical protein